MGAAMETCPPKLIEGVVGRLLPSARREDVLGDLRERYTSRGAYVADALRVVPLVLFSQVRRTSDGLLMALEAYTLLLVLRGSPWPTRGAIWIQLSRLALPIAAAVAALALRDAYATPPSASAPSSDPESVFDAALKRSMAAALLAVAAACLPQAVLYFVNLGPSCLLPPGSRPRCAGGFLISCRCGSRGR